MKKLRPNARLDFAEKIIRTENGALLDAASLRIAVTRMYAFLTEFDPVALKARIASQPGVYPRILSCLCKLTESAVKLERHRDSQACKTRFGQSPSLFDLASENLDLPGASLDPLPGEPADRARSAAVTPGHAK